MASFTGSHVTYGSRSRPALPVFDVSALPDHANQTPFTKDLFTFVEVTDTFGQKMRLRDFGHAGRNGSPYATWFPAKNGKVQRFSRASPLLMTR